MTESERNPKPETRTKGFLRVTLGLRISELGLLLASEFRALRFCRWNSQAHLASAFPLLRLEAEERIKVRRWGSFPVILQAARHPDATPHLDPLPFTKG